MWNKEQVDEIFKHMNKKPVSLNLAVSNIARVLAKEPKGIAERVVKFNEEFGEFNAEIIKMLGLTYKPFDRQAIIEEGADALQVLLSIILTVCEEKDIDFDEFIVALQKKNKKWESKIKDYKINETQCNNNN